jgi:hypothetical protein
MSDLTRDERLQVMLTQDELEALDDWRFSRRMPSRAAAIRELLRLGLAAQGIDLADHGRKSRDYGVMSGEGQGSSIGQTAPPAAKPNGGAG